MSQIPDSNLYIEIVFNKNYNSIKYRKFIRRSILSQIKVTQLNL